MMKLNHGGYLQPCAYTVNNLSIEPYEEYDGSKPKVLGYFGCDTFIKRVSDDHSYLLHIKMDIKTDEPDDRLPYHIVMAATCAFVAERQDEENEEWLFAHGFQILFGIMCGDIAATTSKFQFGSFVPTFFDVSKIANTIKDEFFATRASKEEE
jgi:hypothetical protein